MEEIQEKVMYFIEKLKQNKEFEVEREIWRLPYRLTLKMFRDLESEKTFKKDPKTEKIYAELK